MWRAHYLLNSRGQQLPKSLPKTVIHFWLVATCNCVAKTEGELVEVVTIDYLSSLNLV